MEPRLNTWSVSLPGEMGDMTKFISTREVFCEARLEGFDTVVPSIGCSKTSRPLGCSFTRGKKETKPKKSKSAVPGLFRYFLNVSLLSQYWDRQVSCAFLPSLSILDA